MSVFPRSKLKPKPETQDSEQALRGPFWADRKFQADNPRHLLRTVTSVRDLVGQPSFYNRVTQFSKCSR
jgi:hypothetical protein